MEDTYFWPRETGYDGDINSLDVRCLLDVAAELVKVGFNETEIAAVLGGNFHRVAEQVWK